MDNRNNTMSYRISVKRSLTWISLRYYIQVGNSFRDLGTGKDILWSVRDSDIANFNMLDRDINLS